MPTTATMIGALLGLGTQMYSNALRKLPYMRHPWEHVLGMGLGVVFVNQLVKYDAKLKEDLDKILEKAKAANERRYFVYNIHLVCQHALYYTLSGRDTPELLFGDVDVSDELMKMMTKISSLTAKFAQSQGSHFAPELLLIA